MTEKRMVPEAEWTGAVYWRVDEPMTTAGDELYHESVAALRSWCAENDLEVPLEVQGCTERHIDWTAQDLIEGVFALVLEDHHADARMFIGDDAERALEESLRGWLAAYSKRVTTWEVDPSVVVLLSQEAS